MKTRFLLLAGWMLFASGVVFCNTQDSRSTSKVSSINVYATPDLRNLAETWANEFTRSNPEISVNLVKDGEAVNSIAFLDKSSVTPVNNSSGFKIVVARDVIVPVLNTSNPLLAGIIRNGVSPAAFERICNHPEDRTWGNLLGSDNKTPIHYYTLDDSPINEVVNGFLGCDQMKIEGIHQNSAQELVTAIQKDPYGFGFCHLINITGVGNRQLAGNITIVPIDKNGNGKLDLMEDIYTSMDDFTRGVWIGKYPKGLTGNIYAVTPAKPENGADVAFLNWVLTSGQQFLNSNGYCDLVSNERQTQLDKLANPVIVVTPAENNTYATLKMILLVLLGFTIAGILIDIAGRYFRSRKAGKPSLVPPGNQPFDEASVVTPKGLFYDKSHTWTFMEKDGSVRIGIDDFLQHAAGPFTRIEMKKTGDQVRKGDLLMTLV